LIHGTDAAFLKIRREGISPMTRQHVHLAQSVAIMIHIAIVMNIYISQ
jgi:RNA:NAD 2'-phosphotransferase (TPT1/KptA family)